MGTNIFQIACSAGRVLGTVQRPRASSSQAMADFGATLWFESPPLLELAYSRR
jgi:hypothetical protein